MSAQFPFFKAREERSLHAAHAAPRTDALCVVNIQQLLLRPVQTLYQTTALSAVVRCFPWVYLNIFDESEGFSTCCKGEYVRFLAAEVGNRPSIHINRWLSPTTRGVLAEGRALPSDSPEQLVCADCVEGQVFLLADQIFTAFLAVVLGGSSSSSRGSARH
jgi:hypothetical protein